MKKDTKKKDKDYSLPEITGFLNLSRRYIREIELLQDINLPEKDAAVIKKAALQVGKTTLIYYAEDLGGEIQK